MQIKPLTALVMLLSLLFVPNMLCAGEQDFEEIRHKLASGDYEIRKSAVHELIDAGKAHKLSRKEIDLLLPCLKSDSDWRIKVESAMALLYARDSDWVIDPLIAALQDRGEKSSGSGNVPLYASDTLAELGDSRALKPLREWLKYLESNPNIYPHSRTLLIERTKKLIVKLEENVRKQVGA
jgi:hypothetical protein